MDLEVDLPLIETKLGNKKKVTVLRFGMVVAFMEKNMKLTERQHI